MAVRPVFLPMVTGNAYVGVELVEFEWIPGMAKTQRQKCVDSLHASITSDAKRKILEISSKSRDPLGIQMSAFNLGFKPAKSGYKVSVESAFQGSKVFEGGGPFWDIYSMNARDAKKFFKDKNLGKLLEFNFYGQHWALNPFTLFYDWIYMNSLRRDQMLAQKSLEYDCFTDIEFNPKKSINCQAYSVALFTSLCLRGEMEKILENRETYIYAMGQQPDWIAETIYSRCHTDAHNLLF
jgi:Family of unknown function (DUF6977)